MTLMAFPCLRRLARGTFIIFLKSLQKESSVKCAGTFPMCRTLHKQTIIHREANKADPSHSVHTYSPRTSNSSLRPHIWRRHIDLFMRLAPRHNWNISLLGLASQSQSQASSQASTSQVGRPAEFNQEVFYQRLVDFIVVDDQVFSSLSLSHSFC